jgi:hypothetical protein
MEDFGRVVQEWQTFYATIVASSATLVGLLFVAVAVNPNTVVRANTGGIRLLARHTFTSFLYMIGIGITFLIPRQVPLGLGLPLMAIGIMGLTYTIADLRGARTNLDSATDKRGGLRRSAPKLAALVLLICIAIVMLVTADPSILWWMIAPMMLLLISASNNTWVLMTAVQEASTKG